MGSGSPRILLAGHPILRRVARRVVRTGDRARFRELYHELTSALGNDQGLAAPQLGHSIRAFVVAPADKSSQPWMAVNPEIMKRSRASATDWEACLSLPGYAAVVERSCDVDVCYYDLDGRRIHRRLSGQEARVFQHELDHLDGILYTDRADLRTLTHEAYLVVEEDEERDLSSATMAHHATIAGATRLGAVATSDDHDDDSKNSIDYYDEYELCDVPMSTQALSTKSSR
eukprot:scaffold108998_cov36-Tisochrysis_lutea.AAC.1